MPSAKITEQFTQWVLDQLQAHKNEVSEEMDRIKVKKSITVTAKLKLRKIGDKAFEPHFIFSVPRASVTVEAAPDHQQTLPGM